MSLALTGTSGPHMMTVLVNFSFRQVIKCGYLLALICDIHYQLKCMLTHRASKPRICFLIPLGKYNEIKFFFLKNETNNLHFTKVNKEPFYRNMLNTLKQGGKKIRKAKWNVTAQINCVDKFSETSRIFTQNAWENRTETRQKPCRRQLHASSPKGDGACKTADRNCLEKYLKYERVKNQHI